MKIILCLFILFSVSSNKSYASPRYYDYRIRALLFGNEKNIFNSEKKNIVKTKASVVSINGDKVFEKYIQGNSSSKHLIWSMTKSISSLIFGIVESQGLISKEDSLYKFFPEQIDSLDKSHASRFKKIKLKDLLEMASGIDWNEFYEEAPFNSDVVKMLYVESRSSVLNYVLKRQVKYLPGKRFHYSSGDTNVIMAAIQKVLPKDLKQTYPWKLFFEPLEINATFETDAQGVFLGSSYAYLSTDDLLKIGELIINKGKYKDKQIVPEDYIRYATKLNQPMSLHGRCMIDHHMTYGAQFWLNHECPDGKKPFKDAPSSMVMLLGHGGQSVFIFPEEKIVAVRIAEDKGDALDKNEYAKLILETYAR